MTLTDDQFNILMKMEKIFQKQFDLPGPNESIKLDVISKDKTEKFHLDLDRRGKLELHKCKLQNRYQKEPIIRLEIDAPPHRNPDGTITSRNHIHIYREGYGLSWAYDISTLDKNLFKNLLNFIDIFTNFCKYCNIKLIKNIQGVI